MSSEIIVSIISFAGTAIGSIVAVLTANSLTSYKIEELRKQVEKHNQVVERVYRLEQDEAVIAEKIAVVNHRIADLEKKEESV
jgi:predicted acylesterase/phospholipase RssA